MEMDESGGLSESHPFALFAVPGPSSLEAVVAP
jgi:hypothetical protein